MQGKKVPVVNGHCNVCLLDIRGYEAVAPWQELVGLRKRKDVVSIYP